MSYLSAQAQKSGAYEFDIPFSRQQLADYLAVERSGLSVELCKMRDEGLLEFHKSHFVLKRIPRYFVYFLLYDFLLFECLLQIYSGMDNENCMGNNIIYFIEFWFCNSAIICA